MHRDVKGVWVRLVVVALEGWVKKLEISPGKKSPNTSVEVGHFREYIPFIYSTTGVWWLHYSSSSENFAKDFLFGCL